jgi:hypothetical protein
LTEEDFISDEDDDELGSTGSHEQESKASKEGKSMSSATPVTA